MSLSATALFNILHYIMHYIMHLYVSLQITCLGMHSRILVLQRHHQFKANLTKLEVSNKVIQNNPFQHNTTILDGSDKFASSYYASTTTYNNSTANTSLDKISVGLTDTDIISPLLLQDTSGSEQRYDTPARKV